MKQGDVEDAVGGADILQGCELISQRRQQRQALVAEQFLVRRVGDNEKIVRGGEAAIHFPVLLQGAIILKNQRLGRRIQPELVQPQAGDQQQGAKQQKYQNRTGENQPVIERSKPGHRKNYPTQ